MRKQSVVMVILLILAISLMGVVSASDDMADDVDDSLSVTADNQI